MSIKLFYSEVMRKRAQNIVADIWQKYPVGTSWRDRDDYTQQTYGLSFDYLKRLARNDKKRNSPSARVLSNMGLQLIIRDPETGEQEEVDYNLKCDWNPHRPRDLKSTRSPTSSSE